MLCFAAIGSFILWLVVGIWAYGDAEERGMSGVLWFLLVLILGLIGLIVYLVVRSDRPRPAVGRPTYAYPPPLPYAPGVPPLGTRNAAPAPPTGTPCKNCGKPLIAGANYCQTCGTRV